MKRLRPLVSIPCRLVYLPLFFLLLSLSAQADYTQTSDINIIGSHDGFPVYLQLAQPPLTTCPYNTLYCPASKPECKNMAAIALAAKTAGKPIIVSYTVDSANNNICVIWNLRFQ